VNREELERLPSEELHNRAVNHAIKHLDLKFLWSLVEAIPVAEAAAGHMGEARSDAMSLAALVTDFINSGDEPEVTDALRPLYLDYLEDRGP
jgi:hypothetical protein